MVVVHELTPVLGTGAACKAMGLWRGAPKRQRARAHRQAMVWGRIALGQGGALKPCAGPGCHRAQSAARYAQQGSFR